MLFSTYSYVFFCRSFDLSPLLLAIFAPLIGLSPRGTSVLHKARLYFCALRASCFQLQRFWLEFESCRVRIPTLLRVSGLSLSPSDKFRHIIPIRPRPLPSASFAVPYSLIFLSFDPIEPKLLTVLLNALQIN
jgi:hypothetical protein